MATTNPYFRAVTITNNSGSAWTNQAVEIVLNTATIVAAGKMRTDLGDIRVFAEQAALLN
jgi:hypothetical protein